MFSRSLRVMSLFIFLFAIISITADVSAQSTASSDDGTGSVLLFLFCCGVPAIATVLVIIFMNRNRKPYMSSKMTSFPVKQVLQSAVQTYSMHGYQVTSQTDQNVTFAKQTRPNIGFLILLVITGILPGIVYWILANRPFSVNVVATPQGSGTSVNIVSSVTGFGAKSTDDNFLSGLPTYIGGPSMRVP